MTAIVQNESVQPTPTGKSLLIEKTSPWGVWWLVGITLGVYYFFWYEKVNRELALVSEKPREAWTQWWSQLIPFYNFVGLHHTAKRLNSEIEHRGVFGQVSTAVAWFWSPAWFGTHVVYLQRRINFLHNLLISKEM